MTEYPTENLIRMVPLPATRAAIAGDGNTMVGYPIVFNTWAEIDTWEGSFRERVTPGAVTKTIKERGGQIRVLFNHGMDPQLGDKPLGVPKVQRVDDTGLWTETELDQARTVQDEIKPRLESGSIDGMSFRFSVVAETWDRDTNDGIDERTITELKLYEYGPVTFPAYQATTVGIRTPSDYKRYREELQKAVGTPKRCGSTYAQRNEYLDEMQAWLTRKR